MYFLDALKVLGRRWPIVVTGLVLILGGSVAALKLVPTQYEASSQLLLLLPPEASGKTTPTNPYLNLQSGLTVTASLIAGTVTTKDTQLDMVAHGFTAEYSVALNPGVGPLLVISTDDNNPRIALATRDEVVLRLTNELARIQVVAGIPEGQIITSRQFSDTKTAEALPGSKIRALAIVVAGGGAVTLIVTFAVDRGLARRPKRRARKRQRQFDDDQLDPITDLDERSHGAVPSGLDRVAVVPRPITAANGAQQADRRRLGVAVGQATRGRKQAKRNRSEVIGGSGR